MTSDSRRETWIGELANAAVPISKLAKSVPHGYKGEKLLQMLVDRNIPLNRAVWYIRTNGATEIVSHPTSAQTRLAATDTPTLSRRSNRNEGELAGSRSATTYASGLGS